MHALVDVGFDIQTEFPWAEVRARKYRNVRPPLRKLWKELREKAVLYGFGRTELMPIREPAERLFGYLTYYLTRGRGAARK